MRNLWRHLQFGIRLLWKNPGFTTVAVIALALGIGANTAIFSVVYATLLAPLPYQPRPNAITANAPAILASPTQRRVGFCLPVACMVCSGDLGPVRIRRHWLLGSNSSLVA